MAVNRDNRPTTSREIAVECDTEPIWKRAVKLQWIQRCSLMQTKSRTYSKSMGKYQTRQIPNPPSPKRKRCYKCGQIPADDDLRDQDIDVQERLKVHLATIKGECLGIPGNAARRMCTLSSGWSRNTIEGARRLG